METIAAEVNSQKKTNLFIFLCGIFITNAVLAEIIGVKIFSFERSFGLEPAQVYFSKEYILDFNLTAGVVIWPIVFIFTDIINEYFGREGVRKVSILTAGLICYSFIIVWIVTKLAPAQFWLDINAKDAQGKPFDIHYAFNKIFMQGMNIMFASVAAFLVGQFLDAWVFYRLKIITGNKMIWLRSTGSTLISQLVDSFLVLYIAFYVFGDWPFSQVISIGLINYIYKFTAAVVLIPLLYFVHYLVDRYLKKK